MSSFPSEHSANSPSEHPALPAHASPASTGLPNDASQHPAAVTPKKRSWLRIVIILLLLGGAIGFVTYRIMTKPAQTAAGGTGRRGANSANAVIPVAYDVALIKTIPITLTALGTVTAYNTVTLKTRVDGQITKVNFQEGQRVHKGQLLIEIDPRPYEATLSQAQGNLARDQANAALAQAQAQRYTQLYAAGVVSKESNQTQEATAGQAVGTLASDRAAIQSAQVNVNYTRVLSPIDGIVGLRQVDIGNIVTASSATGLVVITQVQPISVIFTLPEDQLPQVFERMRGGHKLLAEAWDRSNSTKLATGSLLTVDNQIDTTTGTAKLKAVFDNADSSLYPNQFVNIHLVLENRQNSLVVPAAAIQTGSNGSFVYVIDRSKPTPAGGGTGTAETGGSGAAAGGQRSGNAGTDNSVRASGGAPAAAAPADVAAQGGTGKAAGSRSQGGAGARRGAGTGAGANGARTSQTSYPVEVTNVVIDTTQGTSVVIKSGLTQGQQVVTDGQEKLQNNSRVLPRPSNDMLAARAARQANGGNPLANPNAGNARPDAGDFSNGRGSDQDVGSGGQGQRKSRGAGTGGDAPAGSQHKPGAGSGQGTSGGQYRQQSSATGQ